jgi:hypothetical protein
MSIPRQWHPLKKGTFRFFFIFFILEVFTIEFTAVWLNLNDTSLLLWEHQFFTPPFLWLNNHLFHFPYYPWEWYTFTLSIILVRHITYASIALIGCIAWSFIERKRNNYAKLDFWFRQGLCLCVSGVMWAYGIIKVLPVQMPMPSFIDLQKPLGDLDPFSLLWATMGYGTPYQVFTGIGEIAGATLILFRRTRPIGLLLLVVVLCNVVMINYTYAVGVLSLSYLLLLMTIYLLVPYLKNLWLFLFSNQVVNQFTNLPQYSFATPWKRGAIIVFPALFVISTSIAKLHTVYLKYISRSVSNQALKHWQVKNFVLNGDTLPPLAGDTARWRFWSEHLSATGAASITIYTMNTDVTKRYSLIRDSIKHTLTLISSSEPNDKPVALNYKERDKDHWQLQGTIKDKQIIADLERIIPASTSRLLKKKRQVFEMDTAYE